MGQVIGLEREDKKKRGKYLKQLKTTLKCCEQVHIDLSLKGYYPLNQYFEFKKKQENHMELTAELDNIINIVQDELERSFDEGNTPVQDSDTCTHCSFNDTSTKETLPMHNIQLHFKHTHMESEKSTSELSGHMSQR